MHFPNEDAIISRAITILENRLKRSASGISFTSPDDVKRHARLSLSDRPAEAFGCYFLNTRHQLIEFEELFQGTIDSASVHPREIIRKALGHNAAATIFTHNHPSGVAEPSEADITLTNRLKETLALMGIQVLDHLIVGCDEPTSFAERGLL